MAAVFLSDPVNGLSIKAISSTSEASKLTFVCDVIIVIKKHE